MHAYQDLKAKPELAEHTPELQDVPQFVELVLEMNRGAFRTLRCEKALAKDPRAPRHLRWKLTSCLGFAFEFVDLNTTGSYEDLLLKLMDKLHDSEDLVNVIELDLEDLILFDSLECIGGCFWLHGRGSNPKKARRAWNQTLADLRRFVKRYKPPHSNSSRTIAEMMKSKDL